MKRRELLRHLEENGCRELREGSKHTIYVNSRKKKASAVPRHTEINDILARKICRDLEIPGPS
ncbi:MAG: type II toxin-antitoxin system HicA family toxin [Terriglobia bacterium]